MLEQMDLVYPLLSKPSACNELKYSLRSVAQNMPHKRIVVVGTYLPNWLDKSKILHIPVDDSLDTKALNTRNKLLTVCNTEEISEEFILMNDDFFVLNPITELPNYSIGSIYSHLCDLFNRHGNVSEYMRIMAQTGAYLASNGYATNDFGVHCPMIMDKTNLKRALLLKDSGNYTRTVYGNITGKEPVFTEDFKCYDLSGEVDFSRPFASTSNCSFERGRMGLQIRERFINACTYERNT